MLIVGETPLSIEDVVAVARKEKQVALPTSAEWTALIQRGADFLYHADRRRESECFYSFEGCIIIV